MRVLEKEIVSPFNMGKKNKHKIRKCKENELSDSSEEVSSKYDYTVQCNELLFLWSLNRILKMLNCFNITIYSKLET